MDEPQRAQVRRDFLADLNEILNEQKNLLEAERRAAEDRRAISEKLFGKGGLAEQVNELPNLDPRKTELQLKLIAAGVQLIGASDSGFSIDLPEGAKVRGRG